MLASAFLLLPSIVSTARAVTVYGQIPLAQTASGTSGIPTIPTLAAYDKTQLVPPAIVEPAPANAYTLTLQDNAAAVDGLSIPHVGPGFWGFSLEMSVLNQVLGKNSSLIQVPFLNLMSNLIERSGGVLIRIGGNTQEFATMVPFLEGGKTFDKEDSGSTQTTKTPAVLYTIDMFYMAANISSMLNVKWFFGIPFNDSVNWRLTIAEEAQSIVGDNLIALQAGNEPDFYEEFGRRQTYSPEMYTQEVEQLVAVIDANDRIPIKNMLLGPSVATGPWTPEQVWETNFIERLKDRLHALTVEHYPNNNCAAAYNNGGRVVIPQEIFPEYLSHTAAVELVRPYWNSAALAVEAGKPLYMFETNTASCGGFAGVSDSYGAALWAMDYGFQMAYANFTHGMLHVGGQNVFYNPFTAPPTNQSSYNQWTAGAVYYSTVVLAEAFGKSNTSRIVDLLGNAGSVYTPSYAIYEQEKLSKVALFNYMDDASGAHDLSVTISVPTGVPTTVEVKYLAASSVSSKDNITWAGQTLGNQYEVDGRFKGELNVTTINCDTVASTCIIPIPAPGFALVFFNNAAEQLTIGQATQTFGTTAFSRGHNTATVDPAVLQTSNGHSGANRDSYRSTSLGSASSAEKKVAMIPGVIALFSVIVGSFWVARNLVQ
ncbi:Beta-glucuronidase [Psilocybe cubensis]|uniref:Beta-glucuronidase n=2 Tax=Psilocybe cubensis TaxID=181762 RepID=A0ACB8GN36_PSICU|nr:Beta-glucuronidase [Psilocybe cubensis]KAH9476802.1 Beta-glucuronidase [Psilocybe cubensis]